MSSLLPSSVSRSKYLLTFNIYVLIYVTFFLSGKSSLSISLFQVLFTVLVLFFLKENIKITLKEVKPHNLILFLLLITSLSFSYFFSPLRNLSGLHDDSGGMFIRYFAAINHIFFYTSFYVYVRSVKLDFELFIKHLIAIFLLITFFWVAKHNLQNPNYFGLELFDSHIRHIGYLFTFFLSICLSKLSSLIARKKNTMSSLLFLTFGFAVFFSFVGGRGALLSILITITFLTVVLFRIDTKIMINFVKHASLVIFLAFFLSVLSSNFGLIKNSEIKTLQRSVVKTENIDSFRFYIWNTVVKNNYNLLFGLGPNSFMHIKDIDKKINNINAIQPHNSLIQFYLEWGLVGLFLIYYFLIFNFKRFYEIVKLKKIQNFQSLSSFAVCLSLITHSFVDGTLFYSQTLIIFIIFLVLGTTKNT